MAVELSNYQLEAIDKLRTGSILCGGVGSGKSRTGIAYYLFKVCKGDVKVTNREVPFNLHEGYSKMLFPRDLYIITTAKKRDSMEWEEELARFGLFKDPENSHSNVKVIIDSWNNIKKYKDVFGAFFIFDEQRVVGSGAWVKVFLNIARKNQWILLSATPGDQWSDYIPVFVANGFYKNKTQFNSEHCVFARFSKYPKIERYVGENTLMKYRDQILIDLPVERHTIRNQINVITDYDKEKYKLVFKDRWNPYDNEPIEETGKLIYLLRKVVNSDESRIMEVDKIFKEKKKCIVFYNYTYELERLREYCESCGIDYTEWNGQKHEMLPESESWLYLVQYSAGCEGWNCITTDTIIFYSLSYSYRMTEQAAGRIDRMNTPYYNLYYYCLRSMSSIDLAIFKSLRNKKNFNERSFMT